MKLQYTPDKWNIQETVENGSTKRIFHLFEVDIEPRRRHNSDIMLSKWTHCFQRYVSTNNRKTIC